MKVYYIKLIDNTTFNINIADYENIIHAINKGVKFIKITTCYDYFKNFDVILNIKHIVYIMESEEE